jgi:hypothetical protein
VGGWAVERPYCCWVCLRRDIWNAAQCVLALLGEADILTGQVVCPRSPPDALACFADQKITREDWIAPGVCAYVPQVRICDVIGHIHDLMNLTLSGCLAAKCLYER